MSTDAYHVIAPEEYNLFMQTILDTAQDCIFVLDEDGRFKYVNPAFLAITEWPGPDIIGRGFLQIMPPEQHRFILERWNEVLEGIAAQFEVEIITRTGRRRILIASHQRIFIAGKLRISVTAKDITEKRLQEKGLEAHRQQLERKVRERTAALVEINARLSRSEAALARAQAIAHMGSWVWDMSRKKPEWSLETFRLHGVDPKEGEPDIDTILKSIHPADRQNFTAIVGPAAEKGGAFQVEFRIVRPDGSVIDVLADGCAEPIAGGTGMRLTGTLLDITERRRLERDIVEASQREQQRIGRDIHDTLGQELTGLALLAKAMEKQIRKLDPKLEARAADLSRLAGQAAKHARDIARGLSPVDVAIEGLATELGRMSERIRSLYGLDCRFTASADDRVHDNITATHLFNIAQEAVVNAVKHASPSLITIELQGGAEGMLTVIDDGKGIQNVPDGKRGGIGLRIMRHRADIIGAKLHIETPPGGGTRVSCLFPNVLAEAGLAKEP